MTLIALSMFKKAALMHFFFVSLLLACLTYGHFAERNVDIMSALTTSAIIEYQTSGDVMQACDEKEIEWTYPSVGNIALVICGSIVHHSFGKSEQLAVVLSYMLLAEGIEEASVVYDFEGDLNGWEMITDCDTDPGSFGGCPQVVGESYASDNSGQSGSYIVRSQNPGNGNDWTKGILESPEFTICPGENIDFLYGGGNRYVEIDPMNIDCSCGAEVLQLEIYRDGIWSRVFTKTSGNQVRLDRHTWTYAGTQCDTARIRAYDLWAGGWGHLDIDDVRLYIGTIPTSEPTNTPTSTPSSSPTPIPTTAEPTNMPTFAPTPNPTNSPTLSPTMKPTPAPTPNPTNSPTLSPTGQPTPAPTTTPTMAPTEPPTEAPSPSPSSVPTQSPTKSLTPTVFSSTRINAALFVLSFLSLTCAIYVCCKLKRLRKLQRMKEVNFDRLQQFNLKINPGSSRSTDTHKRVSTPFGGTIDRHLEGTHQLKISMASIDECTGRQGNRSLETRQGETPQ